MRKTCGGDSMMVRNLTAPKNAVPLRDALCFARYSYLAAMHGRGTKKLDMLCDRLAKRAQYALCMDGMNPSQLDGVRRALCSASAIYGAEFYPCMKKAEKEIAFDAAIVVVPAGIVAAATSSVWAGVAAMAIVLGRLALSSLVRIPVHGISCCYEPVCCAINGARELENRIWSAIVAGVEEGSRVPVAARSGQAGAAKEEQAHSQPQFAPANGEYGIAAK